MVREVRSQLHPSEDAARTERLVCERSRLNLVRAPSTAVFRVAKNSYGPLNPPRREGDDRAAWGRFDVAQGRTAYAAASAEAAYSEALAPLRPGLDVLRDEPVDVMFPETSAESPRTLLEQVEREWREGGYMPVGQVPAVWRHTRTLHRLSLPQDGWFVDVHGPETLAWLRETLGPRLREQHDLGDLTAEQLISSRRDVTTLVAEHLRHVTVEDDAEPYGIRYVSRVGVGWHCWAVWLDQRTEPAVARDGDCAVLVDDPDLVRAARNSGLRVH